MEAHIAMMQQQQQNYLAQQQQLAAMGHQQMLARQAPATGKKGKKQVSLNVVVFLVLDAS
jgi:hypothetical protein